MKLVGKSWQHAQQVVVGSPAIILLPDSGVAAVSVLPTAAGSALVEYTCAPAADLVDNPSLVIWLPWSKGAAGVVTAATTDELRVPYTAIRITATAQPCRVEFSQRVTQ